MAIILDSLKKRSTRLRCLYSAESKSCFTLDLTVGNADNRAPSLKVITNRFGGESFVGKNFFTREKVNGFFAVVNLSAGQYHVQKVHFFVDEHVNFDVLAAS